MTIEQAICSIDGTPRDRIAIGLWYGSLNEKMLMIEKVEEFYDNPFFPNEVFHEFGVCDSPEQFLATFPFLVTAEEEYCVLFTPIRRDEQPKEGGWRWGKWGPYIGERGPTAEYLHDEPEIEEVLVFHVLRFPKKEGGE